jgi:hypothetical protein
MTLPDVWPFSMTSVNWNTFIQLTKNLTGESPTRVLDAKGISLNDPYAFHVVFNDFNLLHCGFLFIVQISHLWRIMEQSKLSFHIMETNHEEGYAFGIIYGNLKEWEDTFLLKCGEESNKIERVFYTLVFKAFEKSALKKVFNMDKKSINDQEYIIEKNG